MPSRAFIPIITAVLPHVFRALDSDPKTASMPVSDKEVVARHVAENIAPVVAHETNNEPWYRSRVTIGALVSIFMGVAALFGWVISPEDIEQITAVVLAAGTVVGGVVSLWGRWAARKPLGE